MHSALLIDEILQFIFEVILNDGKSSLCCAARCCQAWKDPALDYIWRQLPSAVPLLSLLPGFSMQNDNIRLGPTTQDVTFTAFHSYAIRVKHIVHCHRVLVDLTSIPMHLFHQLSNLESARIEIRAIGEVTLRMSLAPRLRALALQVGYTKSNSTSTTVHGMMSLLKGCSSLEQLYVRGHSSECLHMPLSSITTLHSLSLHLSSLTEQSFMTVSAFPLLVDFDVHANCLSYEYLSTAIARSCDASFFPALENLKIRARPALVALILRQLPRNNLCSLHVDATGPGPPSAFEGLFKAMTTLPLHQFTLEHAISIDESEDTVPAYTPDKYFTLDHFQPLSKLPLRCFILDSSLPPDLSDPAIEEMTKWWPFLERLELGAQTALENVETTWKPRSSLASLCSLARGCKHLRSLVITLDANSLPLSEHHGLVPLGSHPLASLTISSPSRPDVPSLSAMLSRLFPSLVDVTPGFVGEHEDAWAAVQTTVSNLGRRSS
ncbi:hypothetical protein J3R82DRAFT_2506 [Butyriboletus roseoflavus]|nr:hypothetical protein J3R82DRAFT_2506 [Butyriboletus roseoflavus]